MYQYFATHKTDLQYAFWGFTAIAVLLGSKLGGLLSKFPGLTRPGGFYSRLTIGLVLFGFMACVEYFYDRVSNHIGLHVTEQALQFPINEAEYCFGLAAIVALLFFAYPSLGRLPTAPKTPAPPENVLATPPEDVPAALAGFGQLLILIGFYGEGVLAVFIVRQYLFSILHWFRGYEVTNTQLFVAAGIVPALRLLTLLVQTSSRMLDEDRGGPAIRIFTLVGGLLLIIIGLVVTVVFGGAGIGLFIYFAHQAGWIILVIWLVSTVGTAFILLLALWVNKLKSGTLVGFYTAVPTVLAGLIQLGLTTPKCCHTEW